MEAGGFVIQCEINLERKVRIDWVALKTGALPKRFVGGGSKSAILAHLWRTITLRAIVDKC